MKPTFALIAALAALPFIAPSAAEAAPRCKNYKTVISGLGKTQIASARVCRNAYDEWHFKKLTGSHKARAKLAKRVRNDLWDKGYGVLVGYGDHYDHHYDRKDRYHAANYGAYKNAKHQVYKQTPYHYAKYKKRKRYARCDN